jgi:hypothetical protein
VALRIAFDMDGVFADMDGELARHAELLFAQDTGRPGAESEAPPAVEEEPVDERAAPPELPTTAKALADLTNSQTRRLWRHVERIENFWETLNEIEPGSVARLAALAAERRWEVIFLTKRPDSVGYTAQVQTQRWLEAHGFPLPSVYVVQRSRGGIAAALALDVVVDDRPENCLDVVVDSKARAILVWREGRELLPAAARRLGIGVITSVGQCLDILAQLDQPEPQPAGMGERILRLLGLKNEPARA